MADFQFWLEGTLGNVESVNALMNSSWAWPVVESAHFIGLTLLFGCIAAWDLRLLGLAKHVPIDAFHRLVPVSVAGFAINAVTGTMFLIGAPNQYVYNRAFHFKLLFLALAGINVLAFYTLTFGRRPAGAKAGDPRSAKVAGAVSLACWTAVIICGRLITFFRPFPCTPEGATAFLLGCLR
jgi:hypothetical protein